MDAKVYDTIARVARKYGGVGAARVASMDGYDADTDDPKELLELTKGQVPVCPWGCAMKGGAIDFSPYTESSVSDTIYFGKRFKPYNERKAKALGIPGFGAFDSAVNLVRNRLRQRVDSRVPWPEVAKVLGIKRDKPKAKKKAKTRG